MGDDRRMQGQALPTWFITTVVVIFGLVIGLGLVVWFISMASS